MTTPPLEPEEQHRTKEEALIAMTTPTPRTDEAFSVSLEWHQYVAHVREKCAEMEQEIFLYQKRLLDFASDAAKAKRDLAAAQEARQRAEAERDALLLLARKMGFEGKLTVWTDAVEPMKRAQRAEERAERNARLIAGLLAHLPENWGDQSDEGEFMLRVDSDAIDAAIKGDSHE